jgi:hypothetical protein
MIILYYVYSFLYHVQKKNTMIQKEWHVAFKHLNVPTCLAGSVAAAGGVTVDGTAFLAATDGAASVGGTFRFSALEAAAATVFGADFSAAGTGSFSTTTAGDIFSLCFL